MLIDTECAGSCFPLILLVLKATDMALANLTCYSASTLGQVEVYRHIRRSTTMHSIKKLTYLLTYILAHTAAKL